MLTLVVQESPEEGVLHLASCILSFGGCRWAASLFVGGETVIGGCGEIHRFVQIVSGSDR